MKKAALTLLLFGGAFGAALAFRALPSGYAELQNPRANFISPFDYSLVVQNNLPARIENNAFLIFVGHLDEIEYKAAEAVLLKEKSAPVNALNLSLLYLYLDNEKEARLSFKAWQRFVNNKAKLGLIDLLKYKKMLRALTFFLNQIEGEEVKLLSLFALASASNNKPIVRLILRNWLKKNQESQMLLAAKLEHKLNAQRGELVAKDFNGIQDDQLRTLVKGLYFQNKNQFLTTFNLWYKLITDSKSEQTYSRDIYTRLIRLMIRLKRFKQLEDYLDNPPIFLQPAVPGLQRIVQEQKRKSQFKSNVIKIKVVEETSVPLTLEEKKAQAKELEEQAKPQF